MMDADAEKTRDDAGAMEGTTRIVDDDDARASAVARAKHAGITRMGRDAMTRRARARRIPLATSRRAPRSRRRSVARRGRWMRSKTF